MAGRYNWTVILVVAGAGRFIALRWTLEPLTGCRRGRTFDEAGIYLIGGVLPSGLPLHHLSLIYDFIVETELQDARRQSNFTSTLECFDIKCASDYSSNGVTHVELTAVAL